MKLIAAHYSAGVGAKGGRAPDRKNPINIYISTAQKSEPG